MREVFHFRVSLMGAISIISLSFFVLIALLSVLIVYTPVRNIMPGYSASLRQQLIDESARVDSLQKDMMMQRQFLDVIRQLAAGDIETDSVQRIDSLLRVERTMIDAPSTEAIELFVSQYEQKERNRLTLFDNTANRSVRQLHRPVRGVVMRSATPDARQYGTAVRTAKNENVLAVTRGTIISAERAADNTFTVVLQQGPFMAVYRQVPKLLKMQGTMVEDGEVIGLMDGEHELVVELWDAGTFVNPEEVIVW